jgi:hypothetical protein
MNEMIGSKQDKEPIIIDTVVITPSTQDDIPVESKPATGRHVFLLVILAYNSKLISYLQYTKRIRTRYQPKYSCVFPRGS